ncbi:hypothetical protein WR25_12108 isoform G [Diploscapter pachys]|uniref:Major facilitator superfamily (MFS) profile domain-containing protein n=1 Tax=Diploscapter pachys TaxID=2018661 RepID=A0A2A2JGZ2_9BILA|nr:hypothetical protein WR25_12108 isoform G [Diploscapter pachys]
MATEALLNDDSNKLCAENRTTPEKGYDPEHPPPFFSLHSIRMWICLLLTTAMYICQSMNVSLGMSIVCMVNSTAYQSHNLTEGTNSSLSIGKCQSALDDPESSINAGYDGDLLWSPAQQTLLFSASVYGSFITLFFSGYLADKFGPKFLVMGATSIFVFVSLLTPLAANYSYKLFFVMRILMGLGDGFMFPCSGSLAGRWFPSTEKSTAAALYTSGRQIAASLASLIASNLCASSLKWPSVFYLFGTLGCLFLIIWFIFVSNHPSSNKFICEAERQYLMANCNTTNKKNTNKVPWRKMLTSLPLLSAVFCNFTFILQAAMMQNFLPMFLKENLGLPLHSNGIYTMMPFASQLLFKNICGPAGDYIKRKKIMTDTNCVKMFQTIASIGSSFGMLALLFLSDCENPRMALVYLFVFGTTFSAGICGFFTSLLSIAPMYSGTCFSFSMFFAYLGHFLIPNLLTAIIQMVS